MDKTRREEGGSQDRLVPLVLDLCDGKTIFHFLRPENG